MLSTIYLEKHFHPESRKPTGFSAQFREWIALGARHHISFLPYELCPVYDEYPHNRVILTMTRAHGRRLRPTRTWEMQFQPLKKNGVRDAHFHILQFECGIDCVRSQIGTDCSACAKCRVQSVKPTTQLLYEYLWSVYCKCIFDKDVHSWAAVHQSATVCNPCIMCMLSN